MSLLGGEGIVYCLIRLNSRGPGATWARQGLTATLLEFGLIGLNVVSLSITFSYLLVSLVGLALYSMALTNRTVTSGLWSSLGATDSDSQSHTMKSYLFRDYDQQKYMGYCSTNTMA